MNNISPYLSTVTGTGSAKAAIVKGENSSSEWIKDAVKNVQTPVVTDQSKPFTYSVPPPPAPVFNSATASDKDASKKGTQSSLDMKVQQLLAKKGPTFSSSHSSSLDMKVQQLLAKKGTATSTSNSSHFEVGSNYLQMYQRMQGINNTVVHQQPLQTQSASSISALTYSHGSYPQQSYLQPQNTGHHNAQPTFDPRLASKNLYLGDKITVAASANTEATSSTAPTFKSKGGSGVGVKLLEAIPNTNNYGCVGVNKAQITSNIQPYNNYETTQAPSFQNPPPKQPLQPSQSLRDYVKRALCSCSNQVESDIVKKKLSIIIGNHTKAGTMQTHRWDLEPLPSKKTDDEMIREKATALEAERMVGLLTLYNVF